MYLVVANYLKYGRHKMTIIEALQLLRPAAQWVMVDDNYDNLEWLDENQTKPTKVEVSTKMAESLPEPTVAEKLASVGLSIKDLKAALA